MITTLKQEMECPSRSPDPDRLHGGFRCPLWPILKGFSIFDIIPVPVVKPFAMIALTCAHEFTIVS
jgi:hypothetical protein